MISLDSLPGEVVAGQPLTVGFTVLQHGRTPLSGLDPTIRLTSSSTGESLTVHAVDEGKVGHYTATFTLPESGTWGWSIQAFSMDQPMPDLVAVRPPAAQLLRGNYRGRSSPILDLLAFRSITHRSGRYYRSRIGDDLRHAAAIQMGDGSPWSLDCWSEWQGLHGQASPPRQPASAETNKSVSSTAVVNLRSTGRSPVYR